LESRSESGEQAQAGKAQELLQLHTNHASDPPGTARLTIPADQLEQATAQWDGSLPLVQTDRLAQQQPGDHPGQQHQMTLVDERAVLTVKEDQLSMETGVGIHEGLVWCENPNLSGLPAHPMT
jgi:hypothetical protein